ncbi:hypothetical protein ANN_10541 [Periplaneta americana]|uniref:MADF domain-containing protein n=1 Tax=Periplaneta americana TaxID=6978 RepID=A0ABQ8TQD5_PERAM|nr:hypothetical protein ANN_10541 [Periplaneta americana]
MERVKWRDRIRNATTIHSADEIRNNAEADEKVKNKLARSLAKKKLPTEGCTRLQETVNVRKVWDRRGNPMIRQHEELYGLLEMLRHRERKAEKRTWARVSVSGQPCLHWDPSKERPGTPLTAAKLAFILSQVTHSDVDSPDLLKIQALALGTWLYNSTPLPLPGITFHDSNSAFLNSSHNFLVTDLLILRLRWAGQVARMGESRNAYRMLVGRPEGKRPLGRPRRRWEDNIKMDLREVGYDGRDWINLAQDRDQWRAYVRAAMNLRQEDRDITYALFCSVLCIVEQVLFDEILILSVEENPHVYDKRRASYKDEKMKENTWLSIAASLNTDRK